MTVRSPRGIISFEGNAPRRDAPRRRPHEERPAWGARFSERERFLLRTIPPRRPAACLVASLAAALSLGTHFSAAGSGPPADPWTGHAVIVGVADYPGWGADLFFCDDDAREIRSTLLSDTEHWTESNVELLLDSNATVDGIHSAIDAMRTAAAAGDVCLVYFSGHGDFTDRDVEPYDETGPGDKSDELLAAYDGDILDDDLAVWLAGFTSQRVCVIIDTCYAGGMAKSAGGASAASWVSGLAEDIVRARSAVSSRGSWSG